LSKNLAERIEYTRLLLKGFQQRLAEISKVNQVMAQKLQKDLATGEKERMQDYNGIIKGIHSAIKDIRKEVKDIQNATLGMLGDYSKDRSQSAAEWENMQNAIAKLKGASTKEVQAKVEKKGPKKEAPAEKVKEVQVEVQAKAEPKPIQMTLEEKVLDHICSHPKGVRISEMEEPIGETRMKLGFIAKALLDQGKVQKIDNVYFPLK
jgi:hypothetical protein